MGIKKTGWIPLWIFPVLIIFAIGTVWLRLAIIRTTYSITQTSKRIEQARQDRELLQLKLAAMRSPRRLEILARTKFGLNKPTFNQIIRFKKTELLGNDR